MVHYFNIGQIDATQEEFKNVCCPHKNEKLVFSNSSSSKKDLTDSVTNKCGQYAFPQDL